jgi:hypothetical protein
MVQVSVCPTISINPATLPKGATGAVYNQTIVASGGMTPYTYTVGSGALPPGLSLSSAGALSGTPTNGGAFTFNVVATDTNGCQGDQTYNLSVITPPLIQSISLSETTVTITWLALSGETYRVQYKNGLGDLQWNDLVPDVVASGSMASATDPLGNGSRFYRVRLLP